VVQTGTVSFSGDDYFEASGAALVLTIGGTQPGIEYAQFQADGRPTFAGNLIVVPRNGYNPSLGDRFEILHYDTYDGDFRAIYGLDFTNGVRLIPIFTSTKLTLLAVGGTTNGEPILSIYRTLNSVLVRWPLDIVGFRLLSATNIFTSVATNVAGATLETLVKTNWFDHPTTGTNQAMVPRTDPERYFLLVKP